MLVAKTMIEFLSLGVSGLIFACTITWDGGYGLSFVRLLGVFSPCKMMPSYHIKAGFGTCVGAAFRVTSRTGGRTW
jgi:hypothetical protein